LQIRGSNPLLSLQIHDLIMSLPFFSVLP